MDISPFTFKTFKVNNHLFLILRDYIFYVVYPVAILGH